jgi:predicted AlkP superfamily pyrophosphatase or phosphodiesterase
MNRFIFILLVVLLPVVAVAQTTQPARPTAADRVIIITIDGCRPDLLLRADTPHIHAMLKEASFTFWARTTAIALTLPSHTSLLTGVPPGHHGILWNGDLSFSKPVYPRSPTIFELAHKAGYSTALVSGKSKFSFLAKPGTVDWLSLPDKPTDSDDDVAVEALKILREHKPNVMFIHFPDDDNVGHAIGWGTPEQLAALSKADKHIGDILAAVDELGLADRTAVLLTADHGGAGRTHRPDDPRARHIPWIIRGPGIQKNFDLTRDIELEVNIEDGFATACYILGLRPKNISGKPVMQIFDQRELLQASN